MSVRVFTGLLLLVGFTFCPAQPSDAPWPMIRHDRWGSAWQQTGPDPSLMRTPWLERRLTPNELVSNAPAIGPNNIVYYGSWLTNTMRKVNVGTGAVLAAFDSLEWIKSTPAIGTDHTLYFNVPHTHGSIPGRIYALNPNSFDFDWLFNTNQESSQDFHHCSPIIGPGSNVLTGSTNGTVWRFLPTGSVMWEKTGLSGVNYTLAMTRDDSKVIVPNGTKITALNYSNGTVAWTFETGSSVGTPGVAPDGTVVFGADSGTIYGLNPANGTVRWTNVALDWVRGAPAFSANNAYLCSFDKRLYSLRLADGTREWSVTTNQQLMQGPVVGSDGRIYTNGRFGEITSVSPSGQVVWQVNTNNESRGSMTMDDKGRLYVPSASGGGGVMVVSQAFFDAVPTTLTLARGIEVSGGLSDLVEVDQSYYRVRNGIAAGPTDPPIQVVVETGAPATALARMDVSLTAGVSSPNLSQKIEAFDWTTNAYVTLDTATATTADSQRNVTLTTNVSRFVNASKVVRLKVSYIRSGPTTSVNFESRLDQIHFQFSPAFVP